MLFRSKHSVKVNYKNKIYSFPINLLTLQQLWGIVDPISAKEKLDEVKIKNDDPKNLEEFALSQVGNEIYEIFIQGYTQKQWNKEPINLPNSIIKRLPIRTSFNDSYYFDDYQGIPENGYTEMFEKLLEGIDIEFGADYFSNKNYRSEEHTSELQSH